MIIFEIPFERIDWCVYNDRNNSSLLHFIRFFRFRGQTLKFERLYILNSFLPCKILLISIEIYIAQVRVVPCINLNGHKEGRRKANPRFDSSVDNLDRLDREER